MIFQMARQTQQGQLFLSGLSGATGDNHCNQKENITKRVDCSNALNIVAPKAGH
jgi:hypothetical protein